MLFRRVRFEPVIEAVTTILGASPSSLIPDAIYTAACGRVPERAVEELPGFLKLKDAAVAERTGLYRVGFSGELFIVTEASFTPEAKAAFAVHADDLRAFVEDHLELFDDPFFHGDVIIVEPGRRRIWLFDHEGQYGTLCD